MSELLLELLSEEIPAMMQQDAANAYKKIFASYLQAQKIKFADIDTYVGPRRLTICISGMDAKIAASAKELKGPKISAPEQAIEGFCRSNKITKAQLTQKAINGAEFYVYEQNLPEQNTRDILLASLHTPIAEYVWPKSMYWGRYSTKWVRPLTNILCVFDGAVLPFKYSHLTANDKSFGHKFMSPSAHSVTNFAEYRQILEKNFVVLDANERKEYIQKELAGKASELGLVIKEDAALIEEVAGLVEYPQILIGKIDQKFLSIPNEILINAMRTHQKYFSLFKKSGEFAPYFLFVSNIASSDKEIVISGNEQVLSARLSDALYFYNQDLKTSLETKARRLDSVIFHAKLGTLREKTQRIAKLAKFINPQNEYAQEAALLCKSDIVSEVVDEFPTLQGIMGYYYAKAESLDEKVALAIRDHYKPQGPSDQCPGEEAALLALSDKMDTLCGLILAGEKPSGSKDPFALRRQALGIIRIILENKLQLDLRKLVLFAMSCYEKKFSFKDGVSQQILSFLEERLKFFFKDSYESGIIASVLDLEEEADLIEVQRKLVAINDFLAKSESKELLIAYKRASNILGSNKTQGELDKSIFASEHETALFECIEDCESKIKSALQDKKYPESLKILASMYQPVAKFFDNVMVKDKNAAVANNRMLLLARTKQIFDQIANFDQF